MHARLCREMAPDLTRSISIRQALAGEGKPPINTVAFYPNPQNAQPNLAGDMTMLHRGN